MPCTHQCIQCELEKAVIAKIAGNLASSLSLVSATVEGVVTQQKVLPPPKSKANGVAAHKPTSAAKNGVRRGREPIPDDVRRRVVEARMGGEKLVSVAKRFGVSTSSVGLFVQQHIKNKATKKAEAKPPAWATLPDQTREQIIQLRESGKSWDDIQKATNVSRGVLNNVLKEAGLTGSVN